jgi:hypothetical protein
MLDRFANPGGDLHMAIKIVGSYKIVDTTTGSTLAPNPDVPNATYALDHNTAQEVKAFILANANAQLAPAAANAAAKQAIVDAIDDV